MWSRHIHRRTGDEAAPTRSRCSPALVGRTGCTVRLSPRVVPGGGPSSSPVCGPVTAEGPGDGGTDRGPPSTTLVGERGRLVHRWAGVRTVAWARRPTRQGRTKAWRVVPRRKD